MSYTREEAATRACCGPAYLHPMLNKMCASNQCMAWRWVPEAPVPKVVKTKAEALLDALEPPATPVPVPERTGYCGLAGPV